MLRVIAFDIRRLALVGALLPAIAYAQDTVRVPVPPVDTSATQTGVERSVGVLRPGDALKIAVWREQELSGEYLIDARGLVQIPGLGDIVVAGLTPMEAKDRLSEQLVRRGIVSPEIAVQPVIRVSVLGEVRSPGLLSVEPGTNLIHLITLAGGPTERANMKAVRVIRAGRPYEVRARLTGVVPAQAEIAYCEHEVWRRLRVPVTPDRLVGLTRRSRT